MRRVAVLVVLAVSVSCSKEEKKESAMAAIASASLAVRPVVPASAAAPAAPEKPVVKRPKDIADLMLTSERRSRLENFASRASGFVAVQDLETKLYALDLARGKDEAAVKALDGMARGKWVLFTGNIGALTADGFELPVRYTPKDPNDPMGITSVWLPIRFSKIQGYSMNEYKPGMLAVVLARYDGDRKVTEGYDVVQLEKWFDPVDGH
jgi:hypothetical protein